MSAVSARGSPGIKLKFFLMLDPRAQTLLKTLIERYIAEGQPVGSKNLGYKIFTRLPRYTRYNMPALNV